MKTIINYIIEQLKKIKFRSLIFSIFTFGLLFIFTSFIIAFLIGIAAYVSDYFYDQF